MMQEASAAKTRHVLAAGAELEEQEWS